MIDAATVKRIFPFSIFIDNGMNIRHPGRTLESHFGVLPGTPFLDSFEILRQRSELSREQLLKLDNTPIQVRLIGRNLLLMGQVVALEEGFLFLTSPKLDSVEDLKPLKLKINHFAPHDGVMTSLFQLQRMEVAAAEAISSAQDLANQQEIYRQIVEQSNDLIIGLHPALGLTFANPVARELLGIKVGSTQIEDLFTEEDRAKLNIAAQSLRDGAKSAWIGLSLRSSQGQLVEVDGPLATSLLEGDDETLIGFFRDVTARNIAERELRISNERLREAHKMEAIGRFAGGIAHDFNNLLSVVSSAADLLQGSLDRRDPRRADVDVILSTAEKGAALARQLLQFSRRNPQVKGQTELLSHTESLREALSLILGNSVDLQLPKAESHCYVKLAPVQYEQILMNLMVNAKNAMPEGGRITVEIEEHAALGHAILRVCDTGIGMPDEVMQRIFEPFFSTNQHEDSSGLGLSVVYGIIDEAGGDIHVESELGEGTTFSIVLPLDLEANDHPLEVTPKDNRNSRAQASGRVVLVEDQPDLRRLITRALEEMGLEVLPFDGVETATEGFRTYPGVPDLLITDVILGDGNGLDLAEKMEATGRVRRVIITTGNADFERIDSLSMQHGWQVLMKPFRLRQLNQLVTDCLAGA